MELKKKTGDSPIKLNLKKEKKPKQENGNGGGKKGLNLDVATLKKYFNQKTFTGIIAVGVCLLVVLYVFVYLDYTERTQELEASNATLQKTVDELQEYSDNMPTYQNAINDMKTQVNEILAEYPAGAKEEDILMLAVQLQEDNAIAYTSISMDESTVSYNIPYSLVSQVGMEGFESDVNFASKHATYVNTTTYDDLKSVIGEIYASPNRIGIDSILYTKNDEDGTLDGSISLYFYSATGTGKEYTAPDIAEYLAGTSDLFKTGGTASASSSSQEVSVNVNEDNGNNEETAAQQ